MSRRPVMKTSTTKSSRTLTGGTKITTTTNATEVQPYGGASCTMRGRSTSGRGTCPGAQARAGTSIRPNASRTSLRSGTTTARRPSATSLARQRAPAPLKAPAPGQYTLPAPYGPQSRQGRGQAYSSPVGLRAQMESKTPKALRYETVKGGVRAKGRPQLQGTRMQDTFSGGFNVYGAPKTTREMVPEQSLLNEKKILYTSILLDDFHKKVCSTLDKHCHPLNKRYSKILQACTGLFSVYISNSITETILSIVSFTRSTKNPPYLRLFVDFEEGLILTPSPEQVVDLFSKLIDDLVMTGRELNALERKRIKGFESRTIRLCLTEEFIENCKRDIAENINNLYEPVSEYLNQMSGEFVNIYSDIISEDFLHNLFDIKFEEGCSRIQYYKKYLDKVTFVPDNEYFSIGQLVLKNYRDKLHDNLQVIIDSIFQNLSHQHLWEIHDICDSFTLIKMRANQKPLTTEELIEIGKFMFWVRNEKLDELVHRVHSSLASLCNIITLGILSDDHMELNARAINWLDEISPIVEQHSINYDQLKFEAEEKLQKVIEEINVHIKDVYPLLVVLDEMDDIKSVRKYLADIALHMTKIKEIQHKIEWINKEEVCLSFPKSSYAEFDNLRDYVYPFYHLLKLCQYVQKHESVWLDGQFELLDYKSTNERVEKFCQELSDLQKQYRKKLRQAQDENLPIKFRGTVDDPDLLNWPAPLKLSATALKILEDFKPSLKVMEIMCNRSLRSRHWKAMSEIAGFNIAPNAGTTLRKMLQVDLTDKLHEYEIISVGATKEQQLLEKLNELKLQWEQVLFDISVENDEVTILVNLDDVQTILDDHMIKVLNMRSSVFVKAHEQDVLTFYHLLQDIDCVINNWIAVQEDLLKLLPIFSVLDPVNIIPNGKKLFDDCHSIFQAYIAKIKEDSVIINIVTKTDIVADMKNCLIIMDKVKNEIRNYLKVIQIYFPRLFLLSDEELVDIIARIDEFYKIKFLTKIFPGIEDLFVSNEEVRAVVSSTGEKLVLRNGIRLDPEEGLHVLLRNLQEEVRRSLLHHTAECCKVYKKTSIRELVKKYPQQSIQLAALVFWTDQVENALKLPHNIKLLLYKRRLEMYIDEKVGIINSGNINNLERVVYKNLLLTDLNCKYLLQNFLKNGLVIDDNHFRWKVQLRYYFQNNFCTVSILDKSIDYGYEYYGNYDQIVLTPSVEKYYRTILNAFFSNIMGLVTGESGTGKTKTTTSLMEALGLFYVRFCCSNMLGMDILSKLLKGVVLCGAWFILESFDNLREEIFSVFSQELLSILEAKKQSDKAILLDGTTLRFDPRCFVCVITNTSPSKIFPENLKALFRTYTLSTPDFRALTETLLLSKGTLLSRSLSRTLVRCLELLKDEISFQNQYSFGLRTLSTILNYFEQERLQNPHQSDDKILYRSIRKVFDMTLSPEDASIFNDTLKNIYNQESDVCQSFDANLEQAWKDACSSQQIDDVLMTKGLELVEALTNKSSIILIGGISVGKSSCLDVCIQTLETIQNKAMVRNCINPDCLSYPDLYGEVSRSRNFGWIDGVLLRILRKQSELPTLIVFDGQIDPGWAETLSGILEGKKIFLESGEVLLIRNSINLVFETDNLKHCSPSMISNDTAEHLLAIGSEDVEAVEDEVTQELFSKSMLDQHEKVYCRGHHISEIKQQMITTPAGLEPVIQQAYTERKLERDMGGEKLVKNLSVVEMDECSGKGIKVIISEQQLDPDFGLSSEGTDTVTVRETISVTPSYTSTARDVTHEVTKPKLEIDPAEVARLVQEENEDVENTLKIAPPDLVLTEEKYGIKKRLQQLRLNSESMALIEEAVISPTVNADEALGETTPEAIVQIMHTVESGVAPECAPDQVFHTLFEDKPTEQSVVLSSIGPGPLQDVVVPQQLILDLQKEPLSTDLNKLTDIYKNVTDAEDWPHVDVFASVMEEEQKHPNKGVQSRPFKPIADEEVPWGEEDLEPLVNIVGAEPVSVLDPFNVSELQESGNFEKELTHGIEYFIDADPVQYMSRVQLRGSHPPPWFPGYIYALPDFPDIVKVARNPDEVFLGSWKACQPKILPEESITIMP